MNLQALQTFLTIAREGSISKAANTLCVAQSTISKRLQVLEDELKFSLFERGRGIKHMQLTPSGVSFLELSEKWYDFFCEVDDIKKHGSKISLSIGSLTSINFAVFPFLYQKLVAHKPKIDLSITTSHSLEMFNLIEKRQIDVGVSFIAMSSPNAQVYKLYSEPVVGICLKGSPLAGKSAVSATDLNVEDELYVRWDGEFQEWHNQFFDNNHTLGAKLDNAQLVLDLFSNLKQWAIVPASVAMLAVHKLNFATFQLSDRSYQRNTYLIMHKKPKQSARLGINILLKLLHALAKIATREFSGEVRFFTNHLPHKI